METKHDYPRNEFQKQQKTGNYCNTLVITDICVYETRFPFTWYLNPILRCSIFTSLIISDHSF